MSAVDSLYKGAIQFERGKSLLIAICLTLIGISLFIVGGYLFFEKTSPSVGTVKECIKNITGSGNSVKIIYSIKLDYMVGSLSYTSSISSNIEYKVGDKIDILYNVNSPTEINMANSSPKSIGLLFSCISIIMVVVGWTIYYLTNKYEAVAAVQAGSDIFRLVRAF